MIALDLYCGGGGAALGMLAAGFDVVVGIDIEDHSGVYPGEFVLADATLPPVDVMDFDFIWASPPCQAFSEGTTEEARNTHPNLIPATHRVLEGHPFTCIENVPPAPIRKDLVLTGPTVGLPRIQRRRKFELSFRAHQPNVRVAPRSDWVAGKMVCVTRQMASRRMLQYRRANGIPGRPRIAEAREVMGITTKMTREQVGEAVAPPMAEYIAREALRAMGIDPGPNPDYLPPVQHRFPEFNAHMG